MGKKITHDEFVNRVKNNNDGDFTFLEEYKNSNTKILTRCNVCTHVWEVRPADIMRGHGCPVCAGKAVLVGYNDLRTVAPDVCDEWNYDKNIGLLPEHFTLMSGKTVWWKCKICGHEWQSIISNRTNGTNCPECSKINTGKKYTKRKIELRGSLESTRPDLLLEWDYDKNTISPLDVCITTNTKFWWKCKCGHSWMTSPYLRSKGIGCQACSQSAMVKSWVDMRLSIGGSFADNYPEFIKYWDFELNDKTCYEVTQKSKYVAHWRCPDCGYSWSDRVSTIAKSTGCPNCTLHRKYSSMQKMTQDYIEKKYEYDIQHEKNCSIYPRNPITNYPMPYDNEIILSDDKRLIIEVHGQQHYKINIFIEKSAKTKGISPQEEFEYVTWKDAYKKRYAIDNGYFYLELPYWAFPDESYKEMIDEKIQQILNGQKGE